MLESGHKTTSSEQFSITRTVDETAIDTPVSSSQTAPFVQGESVHDSLFFRILNADIDLNFIHLFWIFIVGSFLGLIVETALNSSTDGWIDRSGLVWGPFSPIYGLGGVLLSVILNHLRKAGWWKILLVGSLIGGAFEYFASLFWERAFGVVAWSYANYPLNLNGRTCLGVALIYGLSGLLWVRLIMPFFIEGINLVPHRLMSIITVAAAVFMCVDITLTIGAMDCWYRRLAGAEVSGPIQDFFNTYFDNEFMANRFQTITVFTDLAIRP